MNDELRDLRNSGYKPVLIGPQPFSFDLTRDGPRPRIERTDDGKGIIRAYTDLKRHKTVTVKKGHKLQDFDTGGHYVDYRLVSITFYGTYAAVSPPISGSTTPVT